MRKSGVAVDGMLFVQSCLFARSCFVLDTEFFASLLVPYLVTWASDMAWGAACYGHSFSLSCLVVIFRSSSRQFMLSLCATTTKCKAALLAVRKSAQNLLC